MKLTRRDLRNALKQSAQHPDAIADPSFVDALERQLRTKPLSRPTAVKVATPRRPIRSRISIGAVLAVLGLGGIAVAAPWQHVDLPPQTTTSTSTVLVSTSSPIPPATVARAESSTTAFATAPGTGTTLDKTPNLTPSTSVALAPTEVTTSVAVPQSSVVVTSAPSAIATVPTSAAVPTTATATTTSTTVVSTTTTEVRVPTALTITCSATGATVISCSWSPSNDPALAGYQLLRGDGTARGRVFSTGAGTTTYTDRTAVSGTSYSFVVQAVRADGSSIAHSPGAAVRCCTP